MRSAPELPEGLRGRAFTTREAAHAGVSASRLRRSDLEHPVRGVHRERRPESPQSGNPWDRAVAGHTAAAHAEHARMPAGAVFSHITAAVLHGFPLSTARISGSPVHVTTATDAARRPRAGVRTHPLPRDMRRATIRHGLPATGVVDTWCALSAALSLDELVAIGDHLVRRRHPDATLEQLRRAVAGYAGRHGAKRLRAALELVRPRTDSTKETALRLVVVRAGIPEPAVNAPLFDRFGDFVKHGDLVFAREMVLLEYDGEQHRTDSAQYHRDASDMERLAAAGWFIVRVRNRDLSRPSTVIARLTAALTRHSSTS